jgi:hypothetical protein
MSTLTEDILTYIVAELDSSDTLAVALTGSHARGDATRYSDMDILRFVAKLPETESQRYTLKHIQGRLVSITTTTIAAKRDELTRPEDAIRAVPGLRQMRVLLDRNDSLGRLKQEAESFTWEPVQAAADEYASYNLMGCAEEVHKILTGLLASDESTLAYANLGLYLGLVKVVAVQRNVLIYSDNTYFQQAQEAAGRDSEWTRWFRLSAGLDRGPAHLPPAKAQGVAGLGLYRETAKLLRPILLPEHAEVVEMALEAIRKSRIAQNCNHV